MISQPTGLTYLASVTELLQTYRVANPYSGVWEAADLQWWWRKDQHPDPDNQVFWDDGAMVITDWAKNLGCDLLGVVHATEMLPVAMERLRELAKPVEMIVRDDDPDLAQAVLAAGFVRGEELGVNTHMPASEIPTVPSLPDQFRLLTRAETGDVPHHMIRRNGEQVAERLRECSIYQEGLDLLVRAPDDAVAGYALFWADTYTGVGLVEPMRVEDEFHGRGIGKVLLAEGLRRLVAAGCSRLKVSYVVGNEAAKRLYLGAGFQPSSSDTTFTFQA
jgi:predicted N-acetyltransferase YhbS